jgi:crotonobetainyl-CoA:carnitine CoA-transferase CaiB-like acyl-CoA transferase
MKLEGIRVVDLSLFLPGPLMTQFMADHGAEVVKIESIHEGEPTRALGEMRGAVSVYFANTNRGKKSLALNLKDPAGVEVLLRLAERSDVLVEAFRPGVVARLGIGYRRVAERAPHIVYVSISAFGQSGPYSGLAAHDLATEAMTGTLSLNRGRDGKPAIPGMAGADMLAATMGFSGIMMALYRRRESGKGDYLDISMADCLLACLPNNMGTAMARRRQPEPSEERTLGGNAMYGVYETKDADWIVLGAAELKFATNLLGALGRPDLIELCKLPPGRGQDPVRGFLREAFRSKTKLEWVAWFKGRDIAFAPVKELPEVLEDPHFQARGMVLKDARGWDHLGVPIRFADEPGNPRFALPAHGEHSCEILRGLGYASSQIDALRQGGVVKQAGAEEVAGYRGAAS